jgi:hypothetical protein
LATSLADRLGGMEWGVAPLQEAKQRSPEDAKRSRRNRSRLVGYLFTMWIISCQVIFF